MTTYFESLTENGKIQINDNTQMLYLESKKTLGSYFVRDETVRYKLIGGQSKTYTAHCYSLPQEHDTLIFISNPFSVLAHVWGIKPGNVYDYIDYDGVVLGMKNALVISNVDRQTADNMMIFNFKQGDAKAVNCGIECYNQDGQRVFSSDSRMMKILNSKIFNNCPYGTNQQILYPPWWNNLDETYSYNNRTIAFSCGISAYGNNDTEADGLGYWPVFILSKDKIKITMADKTVHYSPNFYEIQGYCNATQSPYIHSQTIYTVIDVTNY